VFLHGVASGDPLRDGVILWTRVSPDDAAPSEVFAYWAVYEDAGLTRLVKDGVTFTDASLDFTVKVDVKGLRAGRTYYYQFRSLGHESPIGRTRTLPKRDVSQLRFGVTSCSNFAFGYFNAYGALALRPDLDAVLHLGDYIYEYANAKFGDGTALNRVPQPDAEIVTLSDYRTRHAQYKTDPDLQEVHRQNAFIVVWDDHESADNAYLDGAVNHDPATQGEWEARRAAAIQAYFEWMPIREAVHDDTGRIYRSFEFGDLLDLIMLDTRIVGRDQQVADPCSPAIFDPERQLLGETQEQWFFRKLTRSKAKWRAVGQQVMFGQLINLLDPNQCIFNPDQWDGYAAARARVLQTVVENGINNVAILTGDIHSSWANDIAAGNPFNPAQYDPATGAGSVAVEFVTTSVTSPAIEDPAQAAFFVSALRATHPHIKAVDLSRRGYLVLDVTAERMQADWFHIARIDTPDLSESFAFGFFTADGQNHLQAAAAPAPGKAEAPALAPAPGA
jgi:alkaline phosphatase D